MNQIDAMFRAYCADVPAAAPDAAARAAQATLARRPSRSTPVRRRMAFGTGVVATASLAVVLGVLLVSHAPTSTVVGTPRADWGISATVRVAPNPGVVPDAATDRLIAAVSQRARARDLPGVKLTKEGPDRLNVEVPAASDEQDIRDLVSFPSVALYNLSTSLIAEGIGLAGVAAAARALPGPPVRYAVGPRDPRGGPIAIAPTREAAQGMQPEGLIIGLPAGVALVDRPDPKDPIVLLLRDEPVATTTQIETVAYEGSRITVVARQNSVQAVTTAVAGTRARGDELAITTIDGTKRGYEYGHSSSVEVTDDGAILNGVASASDDKGLFGAGTPVIDGSITIEASTPYGTEPLPTGDRGRALPASTLTQATIQQVTPGAPPVTIKEDTIVLVAETTIGSRPLNLYAALMSNGRQAAWIAPWDDGGAALQIGRCGPGAGVPVMRVCSRYGINKDSLIIGRVRPGVARVDLQFDAKPAQAGVVAGGWFLVSFADDNTTPTSMTITARDSSGKAIASVDHNGTLRIIP